MSRKLIVLIFCIISPTLHAAADEKKEHQNRLVDFAIDGYLEFIKNKTANALPIGNHFIEYSGMFSDRECTNLTGIKIAMIADIPEGSIESLSEVLKRAYRIDPFVQKFVEVYRTKDVPTKTCIHCDSDSSRTVLCSECHGTQVMVEPTKLSDCSRGIIRRNSPNSIYAFYELTKLPGAITPSKGKTKRIELKEKVKS